MCICFTTSPSPRVHMPSAEHNGVVGQDINRGRQHCDGIYSIKQTKQSKTKKPKSAPPKGLFRSPLAPTRIHRHNKNSVFLIFVDTVNTHWVMTMLCNWTGCFFQLRLWSLMWFHLGLHPRFRAFFFYLLGHQTNYNTTQDPNRCKSSKVQQGAFTNVRI